MINVRAAAVHYCIYVTREKVWLKLCLYMVRIFRRGGCQIGGFLKKDKTEMFQVVLINFIRILFVLLWEIKSHKVNVLAIHPWCVQKLIAVLGRQKKSNIHFLQHFLKFVSELFIKQSDSNKKLTQNKKLLCVWIVTINT